MKLKRILLRALLFLGIAFLLFLAIASPLLKYFIEKYDAQFTGREIEMDYAIVNPFAGYVYLHHLTIFEEKSDSIALSCASLSANLSLSKLFTNTYEISAVTLNKPVGYAIQTKDIFNFTDLIIRFSKGEADTLIPRAANKKKVKLNILNIEINDGEFHFEEVNTPVNYYIKHFDLKSTGILHNNDTFPIDFRFHSGVGSGIIAGKITLNTANENYRLTLKLEDLNLEIINQYLKDITNYGMLTAIVNANIISDGNFKSPDSTELSGNIEINKFKFGKTKNEDFASFDKFSMAIQLISPGKLIYNFDSIILSKPFVKYERYDSLDNFQTMFGQGGENIAAAENNSNKFNLVIEIAKLVDQLSRNFFKSNYQIGKLAITDGNFVFEDYSLSDKFSIALNPFNAKADSIDKRNRRVHLNLQSGIKPYGELQLSLSINPKDSSYFDINYMLQRLPLSMFNPYITTFTSYPIDFGSLELAGNWNVKDNNITSKNHLLIIDPRVAKRTRHQDNSWIPIPLALAFVREKGNVIDYEIPITGDLNDPKFNLWDVLIDAFKNVFVKPVSTPYRMEVKKNERKLEQNIAMQWPLQSSEISKNHQDFIDKIAKHLKRNPGAKISIKPQYFIDKEKENILLFEAKKRYYLSINKQKNIPISDNDSVEITRMSIKEIGFRNYLDKMAKNPLLFTVQQKSAAFISSNFVTHKYNALNEDRKSKFLMALDDKEIRDQIIFEQAVENTPFNGFSNYGINYNGALPDDLKESYEIMREFDKQEPRNKYSNKRSKILEKHHE